MNGTINLKKLSTKMLDAISTLNTRVDAVPSQIKTNNRQTLATVEQNAEASSRAYAAGQYLAVNGKLYKALNDIAQGDALQENVNIEWVLLGDEVSKLRGDLKTGAFSTVVNNGKTSDPGYILDARMGKTLNDAIATLQTKTADYDKIKGFVNDLRLLGRNRYFYTNRVSIGPNANANIGFLTIPKSSIVYLVLATVRLDTIAPSDIRVLASLACTPQDAFWNFPSSTISNSGRGGTMMWGFMNPPEQQSTQDRIIALSTHNYANATYTYYGSMYAFPLYNLTTSYAQ